MGSYAQQCVVRGAVEPKLARDLQINVSEGDPARRLTCRH